MEMFWNVYTLTNYVWYYYILKSKFHISMKLSKHLKLLNGRYKSMYAFINNSMN